MPEQKKHKVLTGSKKKDLLIVILLNLLGFVLTVATDGLFVGGMIVSCLSVGIPAMIYMALRKPKNWRKISAFALIFGALYGAVLEFTAEKTGMWHVPTPLFPIHSLGISIDIIIGHMLMTAYTAIFYEHFVDVEHRKRISKNILYGVLPALFVGIGLVAISIFNPALFQAPYPMYLYIGGIAIIPPIVLAIKRPQIFHKMAITGIYFFFLYLIFEDLGVHYNYWAFNGTNYIGWVTIFSSKFPFEEIFFWMMFYAATLISFYEIFIDDER